MDFEKIKTSLPSGLAAKLIRAVVIIFFFLGRSYSVSVLESGSLRTTIDILNSSYNLNYLTLIPLIVLLLSISAKGMNWHLPNGVAISVICKTPLIWVSTFCVMFIPILP